MSDPNHAHEFDPNRNWRCKQIINSVICGKPGLADVHIRWVRKEKEKQQTLDTVLDSIEEYLDDLADAEGNGPADYRPNREMQLLSALRMARGKGDGRER